LRALEIEIYYRDHPDPDSTYPDLKPLLLGIRYERFTRNKRISQRLHERLRGGMIDEVRGLLKEGIAPERLIYYGLEYRYITEYLLGKFSLEEMTSKLETAIHRFAKRQMTWFRRMENNGADIHWLDGSWSLKEKLEVTLPLLGR
jgi:tRNA dimethylallyltransferase